ncbi:MULTISPECIES: heavy-metal-associated domain-containing protein [Loigolactobacillus]|uniref:Copper chaperone CopZ n=1 Tax=Loigolactobacillus backii TaxID=375175 RepID=A0A192H1Q2_9LACO|nr:MULTISPECIES: heavy-metal-associated domain-containing protein [Loigolactobacillus]ANK60395.1 heavy metal-binding protein [Loigolactobacillus backii]ANK62167.1 heavy metal-binding protein [Loigolactobacillus backii]ANK65274.1 heavy metal-binding protein [Loigolactobacillus backii]ANK67834.1 heavy metal-binding protein [Loigolactobacillus backii]ANK70819.1 heavy metal-binding protein [Loigolactobacillus backii]
MAKAIMQLDGLTCPSCMQKIEGALKKQTGVENVKVLFNASKVKTDFDESQTTAEDLAAVVNRLGYEVQSLKVKQPK